MYFYHLTIKPNNNHMLKIIYGTASHKLENSNNNLARVPTYNIKMHICKGHNKGSLRIQHNVSSKNTR